MRKKHSFLLTIFPDEEQQTGLRGRLEMISSGSTYTFTNLEELQKLIETEIQSGQQSLYVTSVREAKASFLTANTQAKKEDH